MANAEKIIQIVLFVINVISPFVLAFVGIFVVAFNYPSHIFDTNELKELEDSYSLKPLMNIIDSKSEINQLSLYPLLGKYNGFKGGHKYKRCGALFSGTCDDDKNLKDIYCPTQISNYHDGHGYEYQYDYTDYYVLDKSTCVDYPTIPETNYTYYKGKYLYSKKFDNMTYTSLKTKAISKNEKCPNGQKKCGILNNDLILCLNIEENCPINDIVINSLSEYYINNISYNTIEINKDEYFHFTNEQVDNQIIFDLVISLEHPLSKIELSEENYYTTFQCHEYEDVFYYRGNVQNIKSYQKIYDTKITYRELLETNKLYYKVLEEKYYRKQHFPSKVYIYKKYPIPITKLTYQEVNDLDDDYFACFVLNFVSCGFLFVTCVFYSLTVLSRSYRVIFYIILCIFDISICLFFFLKIKFLTNREIFYNEYYSFTDKDLHRYQLLCFHATYTALAIFHNICAIYAWIRTDDEKGLYFKQSDN